MVRLLRASLFASWFYVAGFLMTWRVVLLPIAAVLIFGLCEYKLSQKPEKVIAPVRSSDPPQRAPSIEALDEANKFFRVDRYLGRQEFFVVFFDGKKGAADDPNLQHLVRHLKEMKWRDTRVIAVSSALPQENRKANLPDSFVFVTDVEPIWAAHQRWGCFDEDTEKPRQAIFFVDRAGSVSSRNGLPSPLANPVQDIHRVLRVDPQQCELSASPASTASEGTVP